MELIIGPRLYSTWSLRPWLVLKHCGADFTVREIDIYSPAGRAELEQVSPSKLVPVLEVEGELIWDSMAISVWCAERYPEAKLWPADAHARWLARSAACEMHGGFMALRSECGMGPDHTMVGPDRAPPPTGEAVARDLRRIVALWSQMRTRFGAAGPYLFGQWSVPDAFFTPVAARLRHYQIDLTAYGDDGTAAAYRDALLAQPDFLQWTADALGAG
ncbi:glutathione S-transferase [uncultured Brevundimonas sp.]|uniref:glutathione S-transferase n=1 Tax=uncultured Brevundimonas sp. TaxID=213418 RepID=UPI0030EBB59F|tara:strand:- start:11325 stop:11975 length:651 start_codon:yes stop_codon:yes gene_type:complete